MPMLFRDMTPCCVLLRHAAALMLPLPFRRYAAPFIADDFAIALPVAFAAFAAAIYALR